MRRSLSNANPVSNDWSDPGGSVDRADPDTAPLPYQATALEIQRFCYRNAMLSPSNELANFREGRDVFEKLSKPQVPGLVCMPIVPPTSGREQQIGQDAAENERNRNQELQNRIHHGFLQGIN